MSLIARITALAQAIGADIAELRTRAPVLPELASDPPTAPQGSAYILRTVENPAGTLQAFVGGMPVVTAADDNKYELSITTSDGIRRLLLS